MSYTIWLDVLFVNNLVIDYFLLRLVKKLCRGKAGVMASLGGAAFGAAGYCLLILFPLKTLWNMMLVHVVINTIMVRFGCGLRTGKEISKGTAGLYIAGFLIGGMTEFLERLFGISDMSGLLIIATLCYLVYATVLPGYLRWRKRTEIRYRVTLEFDGRRTQLTAFCDTGNSLYDPMLRRPVSIVRKETLEELCSAATMKQLQEFQLWESGQEPEDAVRKMKPHLLPFSSLGCPAGLLVAVTLDTMYLENEEVQRVIRFPVVAFSGENSSYFGDCQMILHPNLIDS